MDTTNIIGIADPLSIHMDTSIIGTFDPLDTQSDRRRQALPWPKRSPAGTSLGCPLFPGC